MTTQLKISLIFENLSEHLLEQYPELKSEIPQLCNNFSSFLIEKNKRYGNSALSPIQIFSKTPPSAQISNRLDDKLNRIKNNSILLKNDLSDTFGYLILLSIQKENKNLNLYHTTIIFLKQQLNYFKNLFNPNKQINLFSKHSQYPNTAELDSLLTTVKFNSTISKNQLRKITKHVALLLIYNKWTTFNELLD